MRNEITVKELAMRILAVDDLVRKFGLQIAIGNNFEEYVRNTGILPGKPPITPHFRPDCSDLLPEKAFWIIGRDQEGRIAHAQAMRLDDLSHTSLSEHLVSLEACFAAPDLKAGPGSSCSCSAPTARTLKGLVAYHGDVWLREDFRGRGLAGFVGRLAFGLAWAKWSPDLIYALVAGWNIEKGVVDRYGYQHREYGSVLRLPALGISHDDWLVWITRNELSKILSSTFTLRTRQESVS
ncbi:hypothetical protein O7A70_31985 [Mesorhizobium sp. Cs1299R1N1]|uniref:hypothetical protein n=1 Tax=Mesorhizobium sp. Cs1299R1N1 TaxID=3015172 RepID=UPI00301CF0B2